MTLKVEPEHGPVYFELNTGAKTPSAGLGTWKAGPGLVGNAVIAAVKAGYIHIDCARVYGNKKEVGAALKQLVSTEVVRRSDLWITSKLWCSDHAPEDVAKALTKTLEDLQLDYVDLYLIHWPIRTKPGSNRFEPESVLPLCSPETWNAMEGSYASGQARAIGVSNFSTKKQQDLLKYAKRCHLQSTRSSVIQSCSSPGSITSASQPGVHLSAYSPLGSPGSWVKNEILKDPILLEIAEKLNKPPAQVALRWGIQSGHSVLPKRTSEARTGKTLLSLTGLFLSISMQSSQKYNRIEERLQSPQRLAMVEDQEDEMLNGSFSTPKALR